MVWRRLVVVLFAVVLVAAGCDGDDDGGDAVDAGDEPAAEEDAGGGADADGDDVEDGTTAEGDGAFAISRIDFEAGVVTITNVGGAAADPDGMFVCNRPTYVPLPAGEVAPGDSVEIETDRLGIDADGGEVGLYLTGSFSSADDMVSYVEWGSSGHGRSSVAVEAGLWEEGAALDAGASAIVATVDEPSGPGDWATE